MWVNAMLPLRNFIILESLFCISRPYLIEDRRTKVICNSIFCCSTLMIIGTIGLEIMNFDIRIGILIFQSLTGVELFFLAIAARYKKLSSRNLDRLNERYPLDEDCTAKLNAKSNKDALFSLVSVILDVIGLKLLDLRNTTVIFLSIVFAAHDAELVYFSIIIEMINSRLNMLMSYTPSAGSRGYGYVLIATAYLSEYCTPLFLLLLGASLCTTVLYQFILILADAKLMVYLSVYLTWRQSRTMYSLWVMCSAVARSDALCKELALHLLGRLSMDESVSKDKNPRQYKRIRRWYSMVIFKQPRYISGSLLTIGLSTPILVLDLSINYMLIIVQMYLAYR